MIRSTECPLCQYEMVFPGEWVDRSIQCPRCRRVVTITHRMMGLKKSKPWTFPWRALRIGMGLAMISGISFAVMAPREEKTELTKDPVLRLRCTNCDRVHTRPRVEWEAEVFDSAEFSEEEVRDGALAPEELPSNCPGCEGKTCYPESKTALCTRCGHWAPSFEPILGTAFHNLPKCRHCTFAAAARGK